jgi:hypothetical protein
MYRSPGVSYFQVYRTQFYIKLYSLPSRPHAPSIWSYLTWSSRSLLYNYFHLYLTSCSSGSNILTLPVSSNNILCLKSEQLSNLYKNWKPTCIIKLHLWSVSSTIHLPPIFHVILMGVFPRTVHWTCAGIPFYHCISFIFWGKYAGVLPLWTT